MMEDVLVLCLKMKPVAGVQVFEVGWRWQRPDGRHLLFGVPHLDQESEYH